MKNNLLLTCLLLSPAWIMKFPGGMNSETSLNHPALPSTAKAGGGGSTTMKREVRGECVESAVRDGSASQSLGDYTLHFKLFTQILGLSSTKKLKIKCSQ